MLEVVDLNLGLSPTGFGRPILLHLVKVLIF